MTEQAIAEAINKVNVQTEKGRYHMYNFNGAIGTVYNKTMALEIFDLICAAKEAGIPLSAAMQSIPNKLEVQLNYMGDLR